MAQIQIPSLLITIGTESTSGKSFRCSSPDNPGMTLNVPVAAVEAYGLVYGKTYRAHGTFRELTVGADGEGKVYMLDLVGEPQELVLEFAQDDLPEFVPVPVAQLGYTDNRSTAPTVLAEAQFKTVEELMASRGDGLSRAAAERIFMMGQRTQERREQARVSAAAAMAAKNAVPAQ